MAMKPLSSRSWLPVGFAMLVVGWGANQFSPMLLVYRAQLGLSAGTLALLFGAPYLFDLFDGAIRTTATFALGAGLALLTALWTWAQPRPDLA
jgi:hypothetical protein